MVVAGVDDSVDVIEGSLLKVVTTIIIAIVIVIFE